MGFLRKSTLAAAVIAAGFSTAASADYLYGFGNVSISRLDWTDETEEDTGKKDFTFLEIEGGAGFDWGEVYGFFDLENPHKKNEESDGDGRRTAMKGTLRYYLGSTPFNIYAHIYDFDSAGFTEQNRLLGVGFNYQNANTFFKPFLAVNNTNTSAGFSGFNGYVAGWVAGYSFSLLEQSFMATNWNEYEFDRDTQYGNVGKDGWNGAAALWWNANEKITLGLQYRYADDKLGLPTYQDGLVYTLKYNL
ncbi:outer membrane protein OmpK [Endozoicomonas sp. SCSIO W0465]|uniref:outer membrane protein OmpK n=1 Tax=Endozoicomonas sp. SCSIO W0465 TaxID=2918516 RepID=UPI002075BEA0|nr:outer membrane protein OmpK [Endozoicomonas sp. SCSIO W0465]USE35949.1 ion channel protein Tsx [Endozoicomonas sp. SCSIO W0465]